MGSISTDDCRGFWNSCTLYLPVQHTGTYAYIHPICSPFLRFRQLYKSPLDLDSADCSVAWGKHLDYAYQSTPHFPALCYSLLRCVAGLPPGRRQMSEMRRVCKKNIFRIRSKLKNIIETMKEFELLILLRHKCILDDKHKLIFRVTVNKKIWFINFLQESW